MISPFTRPKLEPIAENALVVIAAGGRTRGIEEITAEILWLHPAVSVLVVGDDGVAALPNRIAGTRGRVHVLRRGGVGGMAAAWTEGFRWGLARGFDVLVGMCADGSHRAEDLELLLCQVTQADLVIGSRWAEGGRVINSTWWRRMLSRAANMYVQLALGWPVRDATSGFRAIRSTTAQVVGLDTVPCCGVCFQVGLARRAFRARCVIAEVPITFDGRRDRKNMRPGLIVGSFTRIAKWALRDRVGSLHFATGGGR